MPARKKPQLPPAVDRSYKPFQVDEPGKWLVLSDIHLPYHEVAAVEAAVREGQRHRGINILLNGDILDSHELSRFDKDPSAPRYLAEREATLQFFAYLRDRFPKSRMLFKAGNHEERLDSYLIQRAPAIFGLEGVQLPAILKMADHGIEFIGDKRVIRLGRLSVIHGHEYKPNVMAPVNPARGIFLRAKSVAMCGHFHQTSEHHEPTIAGKPQAAWSAGCLCQLSPAYSPLNKWNHGATIIEIGKGGDFSVRNFRVIDGKVV